MRQSDIKEQVVEPIISGMNLADMKIYTDNSGEVQEGRVRARGVLPSGAGEALQELPV